MKIVKILIKTVLALVLILMLLVTVRGLKNARVKYDVSTQGVTIPTFTAMDIPFDQSNDFSTGARRKGP